MKARLSITTAVAALALVAPAAALAGGSPDDRALPRGTTWNQPQPVSPDDRALPRGTTWNQPQPISPDDRVVARGTTFSQPTVTRAIVVSPDDRSFARSNPSVSRPTLVRVADGGFDWTDAGVGAASGFGIALVLLGAGLAFTRRDSHGPLAT